MAPDYTNPEPVTPAVRDRPLPTLPNEIGSYTDPVGDESAYAKTQLPSVPIKVQRPDRPLPDALNAVAEAAAAVQAGAVVFQADAVVFQADAELVGAMLAEIRAGWLWQLLTTKANQ